MVKFYHTLTCPQCRMIDMLLKKYQVETESCTDVEEMKSKNITHTPAIELEDGTILQGKPLIDWVNQFKK